jgi:D-alanyl-lipoteichoic acid acyltransferase DltB (MBOAT superfamily)
VSVPYFDLGGGSEALRDFFAAGFEARHTLFGGFALYGSTCAAIVAATAPLGRRARDWIIVGLSIGAMAALGTTPLATVAVLYSVALYVAVEHLAGALGLAVAWLLIAALLVVPAVVPRDVYGAGAAAREFWAFATNVWWLRCVAYVVDRRSRGTPRRSLREFLEATLFFPTFLNGPIETTEQLAAHRRAGPAVGSWQELRAFAVTSARMLLRFAWGVAKVLFGIFYLGQDNVAVFATGGQIVGHLRLWVWVAELYVSFYVIFSGWSDLAIVLAHFCGFEVSENFDRPWRARSVGDFWKRWHISFGAWLRDYVYIPLGGNRRHQALNVMATFVFSGLWHVWGALKVLEVRVYPPRAWLGFIVWGLLNGAAVVVEHWWRRSEPLAGLRRGLERAVPSAILGPASQAAAFSYVALAWVPFFLPPWIDVAACGKILLRAFWLA